VLSRHPHAAEEVHLRQIPGWSACGGCFVPELRMGGLAGLRYKQLLANEPDGPALRRQSGPQPDGAVPAEVELAPPGHAVDGPDRWAAPVTCLVHV